MQGQLQKAKKEIERLSQELKREKDARTEAQAALSALKKQHAETSCLLQEAYLRMKEKKDHLACRQYEESLVFLVSDEGLVCGFTEKALELSRRGREDLMGALIEEVLRPPEGVRFLDLSLQVRPRLPLTVGLEVIGHGPCDAKLTRFFLKGERMIFIVLYQGEEA